jgi:DedD protein
MDQGLKERLIGAAVLVALGVWLIPWLLDGRQEQVELASPSSSVRLPAPDGPLPVRQQTLSLEAVKSDTAATEPHPESTDLATPAAAAADAAVASAEPTPPPAQENAAPSKPSAPVQESAAPPKQIAPAPVKPGTDRNSPQRVASAAPVATPKPSPKPVASAVSSQAAPAHGDWAVQLGSFGAEDNAKKLADKAKVYGYKPEVASFRASGRAMYRVRLGPYMSRAEADATASALSAHGFAPQVVAAD